MAIGGGGARVAAVLTLAAGLVAVGATPAAAADDRVSLRLPTSFTAGGSPGSVSMYVSKRTSGCVGLRTALVLRLAGLPADQVEVTVSSDGEWRTLGVTNAGDGLVVTERTAPDREVLCRRHSTSVRYRVAFLDGAPGGRVTIVAEAYSAGGGLLDRAAGTRSVASRNGASPSPSVSAPTPAGRDLSPGVNASVGVAAPGGTATRRDGSSFGLGTLVMLFGVAMVGVGIALLALLLRRNRREPDEPGGFGYPDLPPAPPPPPPPPMGNDGDSTLILPKAQY